MNLKQIYEKYPTKRECLIFIERMKWGEGIKICPYCKYSYHSNVKHELKRYHCNFCNSNYRVTVGTLFHNTKLDLQKWFYAIKIIVDSRRKVSVRELARKIESSKNTSWYVRDKINQNIIKNLKFLIKLIDNL